MGFLKKLLIIPPIVIGVAIFMYMKGQKQGPQIIEAVEVSRAVRYVKAQPVVVVPKIHGFGEVAPGKEWVATAQISGEIIAIHPELKKGAILKAGSVLVTISPVDFELAIAQAKANIRSTEAKITEFSVSRQNTQAVLELEKQSLTIREGELARQQKLVKNGTVSRTSFDRERRDTFVQRKKVQDLENSLRLLPTQLAVQTEQKAVFAAQLRSAELNLKRTEIVLPFDARISDVDAEIAQFAQVGKTLVKTDGVEIAEIEAQLPIGKFLALLKAASGNLPVSGFDTRSLNKMINVLEMKVKIHLTTGGKKISWDGKLERISDVIDPKTRTVGIIATVSGAYAKAVPGERPPLAKGLFVEMEVTARALGTHFIVPRLAVHDKQLYIAGKDNRLEIRQVETGLVQEDFIVISKGLGDGEKVVVSDLDPAITGMLLAPQEHAVLFKQLSKQASGVEVAK